MSKNVRIRLDMEFVCYFQFVYSYFCISVFALNGANCLQVNEQHPLIFWFCLGRLTNMNALDYKRNNDYSIDLFNFRRVAI